MKTICNITYPVFALFALAFFALVPEAQAVCQKGCDLTDGDTFLGDDALLNNIGLFNTAVGSSALFSNTNGGGNTAMGYHVLYYNTTGSANTAIGTALFMNTTGSANTAIGDAALYFNTIGDYNTATGWGALYKNTTGNLNTANGYLALYSNGTGSNNTASGDQALFRNKDGNNNTASGYQALAKNTTGDGNIALGFKAGANLTIGDKNIDIGNEGVAFDANTIRIGSGQTGTFIAGISGVTVPTGVAVIIDTDGHLGTVVSSARFKDEIKPMGDASEAILALKPVTFRYKHELDPDAVPQFGLVAEDVERVNPDLVIRDEQGKPYTVRYEAVNAMLLNEFLKEHRRVQELEATVAKQQKDFQANAAHQQKQIEVLTAGLQKVSAQVELSKALPQTVLNSH